MFGGLGEEVLFGPKTGTKGHHGPFPDGVDGRIGDLGKKLLEVSEEKTWVAGKRSQWDVIPHGEHCFLRALDHGRKDHIKVLSGHAMSDLLAGEFNRFEID